ncbi:MAG TPA: CpsB/CapC family capsule biosynthesis tyrosine phosphatase [Terriglobia bacterium]
MIDIHSHILPDIDDGARSLEEAVEMARIAVDDGIEYMVSTPHMYNGLSGNPEPSEILERVAALNEAINDPKGLKILPGNEVHVSHEIAEQARNNRVTKINQRNYMLVEFPQLTVPIGADELFYKLLLQGVRPILVHPERNGQIQANPAIVAQYVERGVFIQVTAMSVTGEFGPIAHATAEKLLRHNCVHFLATDTHRTKSRPPILSRGRDAAALLIGEQKAAALVEANPRAVINGEALHVEPVIPFGNGTRDKKKSFFSRFF